MIFKMDLIWWYWFVTDVLLIAGVAGVPYGIEAAIALNAIQVVHFFIRTPQLSAFPVQVRLAYLALLLVALYPPLHVLYFLIILGTSAMVLFDYCFLARFMSLMPWNHAQRFSWSLLRETFFSKPIDGSVQKS